LERVSISSAGCIWRQKTPRGNKENHAKEQIGHLLFYFKNSKRYNQFVAKVSLNNNLISYAAFLRGINVSGKKQIKMNALCDAFLSWGFVKVSTLLASGNILFDASNDDPQMISETIAAGIRTSFGFDVDVFIRTITELKAMAAREPFKGFTESAQLKLYATFLKHKAAPRFSIPYLSPGKELEILSVSNHEVFSVVHLSPRYGTVDMMAFLEKEFGSSLTTRNWNTVVKILGYYQKKNHV
jgi:uncharacterized protein (DUF1697 family)